MFSRYIFLQFIMAIKLEVCDSFGDILSLLKFKTSEFLGKLLKKN